MLKLGAKNFFQVSHVSGRAQALEPSSSTAFPAVLVRSWITSRAARTGTDAQRLLQIHYFVSHDVIQTNL